MRCLQFAFPGYACSLLKSKLLSPTEKSDILWKSKKKQIL